MKRLRHPVRTLSEPFGKAGLTVAVFALVLAMVGGAYAAAALSGKQKKEVEKIAKKFAGKPGAAGANGTNGTNGAPGAKGGPGEAGEPGTNGTSVTNTALAKGSVACPEGGAEFKVGSGAATKACNGTTGFTETLPDGKTETGTFSSGEIVETTNRNVLDPISFAIPLEAPLGAAEVHYVTEAEQAGGGTTECPGTVEVPLAEPGNLCVYQGGTFEEEELGEEIKVFKISSPENLPSGTAGASTAGAIVGIHYQGPAERGILQGTWAVTAP